MNKTELFLKYFSKKELHERFYKKIRYRCSPGFDKVGITMFCNDLEKNIDIIQRKTLNCTYAFTKYREVLVSKGKNKLPRVISKPTIRDKLTLSALQGYIQESYLNDLDNRLVHSRVDEIIKNMPRFSYYIKIDIKNFYPNIDHELLLKSISKKLHKSAVSLIQKAITTPTVAKDYTNKLDKATIPTKGVPEGLSISNDLANIYLNPIDKYFKSVNDIVYCRYVDDILILCNESNYKFIVNKITKLLTKLKLETHDFNDSEKMGINKIETGFTYLGYHFTNNMISIKPKSIARFENSIEKMFSEYVNSIKESQKQTDHARGIGVKKPNYELFIWKLNIKITGCVYQNKKFGWLFFYSQITDTKLLKHMDWLVGKLFERYKIHMPEMKIKSFYKNYHEIKYKLNSSKYFMNADRLTKNEIEDIIENVFHYQVPVKDNDIMDLFYGIFSRSIKELEKDIQFFS